ncbi:MAG: bifunctional riboflavin kinase/FAD synthetase [Oscillospiraceae bacterium]|nr:bifunctional riboflavin kinase/FAD synthetase [Oscillospiraceae bacterium]
MAKAVLLGVFDGVHLGHKAALDELVLSGADRKCVYTFNTESVTTKGKRKLLSTAAEKSELLLANGADEVISADFSLVKDMSAEEFFNEVLVGSLNADVIICGENFRFGRGASASSSDMKAMCQKAQLGFKEVKTLLIDGEAVSTTRIRRLVEEGSLKKANELLGRPYSISGEVVHGNHIGTSMGIKTLNMMPDDIKALPKSGVYSTRCIIDNKLYKSVTDIGTKPTVAGDQSMIIETHVFDFDDDVYGKTVRVEFLEYFRSEQKFDTFDELKQTILNDITRRKESDL